MAEMKGMEQLVSDIQDTFAAAAEELEEDERDRLEEWADQDIVDIALNHVGAPVLFTDEFVREQTEFESQLAFENALPVNLDEMTDVDDLPEAVDTTIRTNSDYSSLKELVDAAFEEWVYREVDLSEFDVDS
ncbi:uncharacterized protein HQ_3585A [Haloquadratum walsbyi DSM 16790]|uniref:Uncharacterized protein n=1 Tax=Haloquadratum walsbyi (strain DSM 16790 / HBSQ001) TaxID=362976 RepID=J7RUL6_HALWD|nr:uncharacterized protein HQ_3585A [Haloquadratum walsbyi DSM 16790]